MVGGCDVGRGLWFQIIFIYDIYIYVYILWIVLRPVAVSRYHESPNNTSFGQKIQRSRTPSWTLSPSRFVFLTLYPIPPSLFTFSLTPNFAPSVSLFDDSLTLTLSRSLQSPSLSYHHPLSLSLFLSISCQSHCLPLKGLPHIEHNLWGHLVLH